METGAAAAAMPIGPLSPVILTHDHFAQDVGAEAMTGVDVGVGRAGADGMQQQPVKRKRGRPRKIRPEEGAVAVPEASRPPLPSLPPRKIQTRSSTGKLPTSAPLLDMDSASDIDDELYHRQDKRVKSDVHPSGRPRSMSMSSSFIYDAYQAAAGGHAHRRSTSTSVGSEFDFPQFTGGTPPHFSQYTPQYTTESRASHRRPSFLADLRLADAGSPWRSPSTAEDSLANLLAGSTAYHNHQSTIPFPALAHPPHPNPNPLPHLQRDQRAPDDVSDSSSSSSPPAASTHTGPHLSFSLPDAWSETFARLRTSLGDMHPTFTLPVAPSEAVAVVPESGAGAGVLELDLVDVAGAGALSRRGSALSTGAGGVYIDRTLVAAFLAYFNTAMPIFHPATFLKELAFKPPAFLYAVYAVASRHTTSGSSAGDAYFSLAERDLRSIAFSSGPSSLLDSDPFSTPSVSRTITSNLATLQAILILIFDIVTNGHMGKGLDEMWLSLAVAMARRMGLGRAKSYMAVGGAQGQGPQVQKPGEWREAEEKRRTFWALYILDSYTAIIEARIPYLRASEIEIPLPCCDKYFFKPHASAPPTPAPSGNPFKSIRPITATPPFSAMVVFCWFMSRTLYYLLEDGVEDGETLEREFCTWYGLPPDIQSLGPPSASSPTNTISPALAALTGDKEEQEQEGSWDTLRLGMATLVSYYNLRCLMFLKLAPEKCLAECKNVLREIRYLVSDPRFGSGVLPTPPVAARDPNARARLRDLKFPLWMPSLAYSIEKISECEGLSVAMDDLQLVFEILDSVASHGWGIAGQYSKRLMEKVLTVDYPSKLRAAVQGVKNRGEKLIAAS
ncbi:hypothetical protein M427DRAFT_68690 [Gonapodya prolifera JEL478]|uniref:Xylanolytic transcriptional activator regulatory domain-containing protein n=1 Tax=Gonapodya prolifera (strain JEL478) TaxID=1344416 RepID=A0A139AKF7_GONPJ|nr:hypothetical protein M427DRAFT_68690 [Gonapodya prolifera JEL478]|eukprot:KXS16915.1 hypothetical protein M427DRAFT_68690 [Gonapodya prolifera JEL478]